MGPFEPPAGARRALTPHSRLVGSLRETNRSLWVATTGDEETTEPAAPSRRFDVIVVGAGITGLTCARLLTAEGASVAVLEAGRICSGATGYTTAKVTALQRTTVSDVATRHGAERAAMYATANHSAVETVARLTAEDDIDCDFERASACTYSESDDAEAFEREHDACTSAGLSTRLDVDTELPFPISAAVWLDDQAQLHPRRYCLGLATTVRSRGGAIFERSRALDISEDAAGCTVTTSHGTMSGDAVIVATLLPFFNRGAFFARAHPFRSYAVAARFESERTRGMYINAGSPTRSLRSTPDGWIIVGGEGHKVGRDADTRQRYRALENWAATRLPISEVAYRWSAQDYETVDGLPYVGLASPGSRRTFVATGFRKWGMTNGTAAAMMLNDRIAGRDNPWAETFDATRVAPGASFRKLVSENLEVGKRFVADRARTWRPRSVDDLSAGEGDIVNLDGDTVAAFRDDDGVVHAVTADCTHLGCRVTFNTAERSWDCPCHGSRFALDGSVIHGPAVEGLTPIEILDR